MDQERILVGVDGSASSINALRHAARIATAFEAPLEAVTTWTASPVVGALAIEGWSPESDAQAILEASVEAAFQGETPAGLRTSVLTGPTARTLIDASRHAQMLVLGSRGHGGFVGLLLGSVSAACAEYARCPVLIVHGDAEPFAEP